MAVRGAGKLVLDASAVVPDHRGTPQAAAMGEALAAADLVLGPELMLNKVAIAGAPREATADHAERISIEAIDLGELGDWGYPTTHRHRFRDYGQSPWRPGPVKPDKMLDRWPLPGGLLPALPAGRQTRHSNPVRRDFTNRPHYHLVEEFCQIAQTEGRQALFRVPAELDREAIGRELEGFLMVRD